MGLCARHICACSEAWALLQSVFLYYLQLLMLVEVTGQLQEKNDTQQPVSYSVNCDRKIWPTPLPLCWIMLTSTNNGSFHWQILINRNLQPIDFTKLTSTRATRSSVTLCSLYYLVLTFTQRSLAANWTWYSTCYSSSCSSGTGWCKSQRRVQVWQRRNWRWASFRGNLAWQVIVIIAVSTIQVAPEADQPTNIIPLAIFMFMHANTYSNRNVSFMSHISLDELRIMIILTVWCRNYFFLILAHTVYKMWIKQEPNMLELWNKLHCEDKETESVNHV